MRPLAAHLAQRSSRERALLAAATALTAAVVAGRVALAVRDDLAALRARVAAHEREVADVRRAAAVLRRTAPEPEAASGSLVTRIETAALPIVGRESIAAMTPAAGSVEGGLAEERVELRLSNAALPETVELLHAFEAARPPLRVARLELRKHPDDPGRFTATIEVVEIHAAP